MRARQRIAVLLAVAAGCGPDTLAPQPTTSLSSSPAPVGHTVGDVGLRSDQGHDKDNPIGTWYLDCAGTRRVVTLVRDPVAGTVGGSASDEGSGVAWQIPTASFDFDDKSGYVQFRLDGDGASVWVSGGIVDGVLVGRTVTVAPAADIPGDPTAWTGHVTGWKREFFDRGIAPRAWDLLFDDGSLVVLRLDVAPSGATVGTFKVYATWQDGSFGEAREADLEITSWDGAHLDAVAHEDGGVMRHIVGDVQDRLLVGSWSTDGDVTFGGFHGARVDVLGLGLAPRPGPQATQWRHRTRRMLEHLMMADNPQPLTRNVTVVQSLLLPWRSGAWPADRDDDPKHHGPAYSVDELDLDYTLDDPYGGAPIPRRVHAWLAVPDGDAPVRGWPTLVAVNGHDGSGWRLLDGSDEFYWYGDAFARRGYVVIAVDISHRPLEDRQALYGDYPDGDDPDHDNGPHAAIKSPGMDSDWEEDGERIWDVERAVEYVRALPFVDERHIAVAGLSLGGEVTTWAAAMDTDLAVAIPAGFGPDLGTILYHGNHPCWKWQHADIREYLDLPTIHALIAPRGMVLETGKRDDIFSTMVPPFADAKAAARQDRAAWSTDEARFVHYLHYDRHHFHVGDLNPSGPSESGVQAPVVEAPEAAWSLDWQSDPTTVTAAPTLFNLVDAMFPTD